MNINKEIEFEGYETDWNKYRGEGDIQYKGRRGIETGKSYNRERE